MARLVTVNIWGGDGETGRDWVVWSYQQARKFCSNAHLIIDEFEIFAHEEQLVRYKQLIAILAERNLIDGIGLAAASRTIENLSADDIKQNLDSLAELNLPIHITAMEIRDGQDVNQRNKYAELFPAIWEHPAIIGVTLWGYQNYEIFGLSNNEF